MYEITIKANYLREVAIKAMLFHPRPRPRYQKRDILLLHSRSRHFFPITLCKNLLLNKNKQYSSKFEIPRLR